jgi:protein-L-isoaspartate(D-aspartate) O-methyltransferase
MSAAGPLTAHHAGAHPEPASAGSLGGLAEAAGARWRVPLGSLAYRDLWYAAGVWHRRATYAALPGLDHGCLVLLDGDRTGGAAILPDGAVLAGGAQAREYAADAAGVLDRWEVAGRPPLQSWRIGLDLAGQQDAPIWVPARWDLG